MGSFMKRTLPGWSPVVAAILSLGVGLIAQEPADQRRESQPAYEAGELFKRVSRTLLRSYYDREFRREQLPSLVEVYRPVAAASTDLEDERIVVDSFLSHVPASHLALYEDRVYQHMTAELGNKRRPQFGFEFEQRGGEFFVYRLYEGGPAATAGVLKGDRLIAVDGVPVQRSPRRSGSSDDAALDDPPLHLLLADREGDEVELLLERRPGEPITVQVVARKTCSLDAGTNSRRVVEWDGARIGYVHLWYLHITGATELVRESLKGDFADCDALVLDLRGRGGSAGVVYELLNLLDGKRAIWSKPVVCLIDRCSRSGKEAFAYEFKKRDRGLLVGEKTAGALGAAMAVRWTYIDPPTVFNPFIGFQTVLIAMVGGAQTLLGPIVSAVVFSLLTEFLRLQFPYLFLIILGLLLILLVLYLPGGIASRVVREGWRRGNA
jgi:C-terminal processing protease CtpA/Prc